MNGLIQDLRFALRMLVRHRGVTAACLVYLALGIGINTSVFSVVRSVLMRPFPYEDPSRLVVVFARNPRTGVETSRLSGPDFVDLAQQVRSLDKVATYRARTGILRHQGTAERLAFLSVSPRFLATLGVNPMMGRDFLAKEGRSDRGAPVTVIGYQLWKRVFQCDPHVLGKTLRIDSFDHTIVGVLKPDFIFPANPALLTLEVLDTTWMPRTMPCLLTIGRLGKGVALERARRELEIISRRMRADAPGSKASWVLTAVSLRERLAGNAGSALLVLLGAVGLVLLIACVNVANLLMIVAIGRQGEVTIRAAVGATPGRTLRQLLSESMLLAALGGAGGLLSAFWGCRVVAALLPADVPLVGGVRIDSGVLLFALAISALSGTLVGAAPALAAARLDLNQALRGRASAGRMFGLMGHRFRSTLAALEIALALALVIGAALLTQSFGNLMKADPGFESRNRIAVEIDLDFFEYAYERVAEFYEQAAARVRAIPGVRTVGLVSALPVESAESSDETLWRFTIEGRPAPPPPGHSANFRIVNADYFRAMGIPLRRGRFFTAQDGAGASVRLPQPGVVIINEAMAHRFWSRQDPLGRLIVLELYPSPYQLRARIEGIVGNLRGPTPGEQPEPTMYFHHRQTPWNHMWLVAQTQADPAALLPAVRKHLSALGRGPIVAQAHTMEEVLAESIAVQRLMAAGSAAFALLALFLAGMGVYGVTACSVVLRTREIGVRMTLGATRGRIAATIVKEGLVLIGCGLSVGLACALLFTRAIANQLYGMAPLDPGTWVCATLVLLAAALAGCLLPAYRASRIPIAEILRYE